MIVFFNHIRLVFFTLVIILGMVFTINAQTPSVVDTLNLNSTSGDPGTTVMVNVGLVNTFAVGGFSTRIIFDQDIFNVQAINLAERTDFMNIFAIDTTDAGVVKVAGASLTPLEDNISIGSGDIYTIEFAIDTLASPGIYDVIFENSEYNMYENHLSDTTGYLLITPVLSDGTIEVSGAVYIDDGSPIPDDYKALRNYPNPFNSQTIISFNMPTDGDADLNIYNILGEKVKTISLGALTPGIYTSIWNGRDDYDKEVVSGVYCYSLCVNKLAVFTEKMILTK